MLNQEPQNDQQSNDPDQQSGAGPANASGEPKTETHSAGKTAAKSDTLPPKLSLAEKLDSLPRKSGVYLYRNENAEVIYVGKAKVLRSRVRSYFNSGRGSDAKTRALVKRIRDLEIIVTDSEMEALILENTLIKQHKPKYNIRLRDDKSYPYIRITKEPYPRIFATRKVVRDGSTYLGPYSDVKTMRYVLRTIKSLFPIRSCDLDLTDEKIARGMFRVCLDYQIKKCDGPCEAYVSREHYNIMIKNAVQVLKGKTKAVEHELTDQMNALAAEFKFEEAALVRDRLERLREYSAKQKVVSTDPVDRDVLSFAQNDKDACAVVFKIRDGKLIGKQHFHVLNHRDKSSAELLQSIFERFYLDNEEIPEEIILPQVLDEAEMLEQWLRSQRGAKVVLTVPKIGEKLSLVRMVESNARFLLGELELQRLKRDQVVPRPVMSLQRDLRLNKAPRRIECFDNSHFQGAETVSSMVVFIDGKPRKSEYRKYKIKTFEGVDDFEAMREVVQRRYSRMLADKTEAPDLIIVDGGKGQLSSAVAILQDLGLYGKIPIIGLAKRLEEVFLPGESEALMLPRTSSSLKLIQQLRDEAHRFAITFHRSLRRKRTLQTSLTDIEGVGPKISEKLLREFGSIAGVKQAEPIKLEALVGRKIAERLTQYFQDIPADEEESNLTDND
jgi:excinuclease ABC subunit C